MTRQEQAFGTPGYMSPEQIQGAAGVDRIRTATNHLQRGREPDEPSRIPGAPPP